MKQGATGCAAFSPNDGDYGPLARIVHDSAA